MTSEKIQAEIAAAQEIIAISGIDWINTAADGNGANAKVFIYSLIASIDENGDKIWIFEPWGDSVFEYSEDELIERIQESEEGINIFRRVDENTIENINIVNC